MYKDKKIVAIIPARGGSKGLPGKNLISLLDRPLITWTIESAISSRYLDRVIVSTDDKKIADISEKYGAEIPFIRPGELAMDTTPVMAVISHTIDFFNDRGLSFDYIALLEPTSPLRKEDDIDNAIKELIDSETRADSLVSVGEVSLEHPAIMKRIDDGYVKPYEDSSKEIFRRQDLRRVFFPYGVIYLSETGTLIRYKTFYQERTIPYIIERWQNYEVDDMFDLICIEAILRYKLAPSPFPLPSGERG
ncbi:MAG: cytidylyltransferase domain-containing protein [Nitrospirota bacterium]